MPGIKNYNNSVQMVPPTHANYETNRVIEKKHQNNEADLKFNNEQNITTKQYKTYNLNVKRHNSNKKQTKSIINVASTYAIEDDTIKYGFSKPVKSISRNEEMYTPDTSISSKFKSKRNKNELKKPKPLSTLSSIINEKYSPETSFKDDQTTTITSNSKSTSENNLSLKDDEKKSQLKLSHNQNLSNIKHLYGKHIDKLTSELIENLSNGIREHSVYIEANCSIVENETFNKSLNGTIENYEYDDLEDDLDYEDIRTEYNVCCNTIKNSKYLNSESLNIHEKLIEDQNDDFEDENKSNIEIDNSNQNHDSKQSNDQDKKDMSLELGADKIENIIIGNKSQDAKVSTKEILTEEIKLDSNDERPISNDTKSMNQYDYPEVIFDDYRKLFNKYDTLDFTTEHFLNNNIHMISPESKYNNDSIQENDSSTNFSDMYNLLKRMMAKKKYVMHTVKQENFYKKNKLKKMNAMSNQAQLNQTNQLKLRPSTASASVTEQSTPLSNIDKLNLARSQKIKLNRPKTANTLPIKFNNNQQETRNSEMTIVKTDKIKMLNISSNSILNSIKEEEFYHPFRSTLPSDTTWPFEIEFDRYVKKRNYCSSNINICPNSYKNNLRNYPIKKLPVMKPEITSNYNKSPDNNNNNRRNDSIVSSKQIGSPQSSESKLNNTATKTFPMKNLFLHNSNMMLEPASDNSQQLAEVIKNEKFITPRIVSTSQQSKFGSRRCFSAKAPTEQIRNFMNYSFNFPKRMPGSFKTELNKNSYDDLDLDETEDNLEAAPENNLTDEVKIQDDDSTSVAIKLNTNRTYNFFNKKKEGTIPSKSFQSQRKNSISIEYISPERKFTDFQKLRVPLSSYHVSKNNSGHMKKELITTRVFKKIENLKDLSLQHQNDIFSLSENKNDNQVVIYGIKDSKFNRASIIKEDETLTDQSSLNYFKAKKNNSEIDYKLNRENSQNNNNRINEARAKTAKV